MPQIQDAAVETPVTEVKAPKAKKTPTKAVKATNGKTPVKITRTEAQVTQEREAAKSLGVTLVHYRILKALSKASTDGLGYRGIEAKTGYYSTLTAELRPEHEGSLGALGLVKVSLIEDKGLMFALTAKGRKLISK